MEEDKKLEETLDKSNEKLHISDVRSSIQFEVDETTGEIKLPKTLIDIPKEYYF
jgi:hypothetical protein